MRLFHGSDMEVREPRLLKHQRELDFGRGFYTTSDYAQAATWAKRTAVRRGRAHGCVSAYELDEGRLSNLRILRFTVPDEDWLRFVAAQRRGRPTGGDWDMIFGPVANDQTMPVLLLYMDGRYDEQEAIRRLLPQKLKDQYVFKTEAALACLRWVEGNSV